MLESRRDGLFHSNRLLNIFLGENLAVGLRQLTIMTSICVKMSYITQQRLHTVVPHVMTDADVFTVIAQHNQLVFKSTTSVLQVTLVHDY